MKTIRLNADDIGPFLNIFNEVCNGIYINNFEQTIGAKEQFVNNLWKRISNEINMEKPILNLNNDELEVIKKSFEQVYKHIEDWEFQTRLGITIPEMKEIENKILN